MSYLSIEFSTLFVLFFIIYWIIKDKVRWQNYLLLIASYSIVLSFDYSFVLILFAYSVVTYCCSVLIEKGIKRKAIFILSLIIAVTNLVFFKYYDFFRQGSQTVLNAMGFHFLLPSLDILLPIGISFYTFHSVSYLVSVWQRKINVPNFLDFMLFLSFFPSLVAGPINRASHFLPQIEAKKRRIIIQPYRAFTLIILATAKVYWLSPLLADTWVDPAFDNPMAFHSLDLLFAVYMYALQIYFNFSGYTDLVTAIALLLGFRLPKNFNLPYLANNLRSFWQRWHISLSTWIRDYIYIPLGGNRQGFTRTQVNLLIAMLLSGLWHGAGLNFVLWGGIHGIGMVMLNVGDKYLGRNWLTNRLALLAKLVTFHYVCFAWIFFRNAEFDEAMNYLTAMTTHFDTVAFQFNVLPYFVILFLGYLFYPKLANIPRVFTLFTIKRVHWSVLPIIFILLLSLIIMLAPSGIPNFIYAGF